MSTIASTTDGDLERIITGAAEAFEVWSRTDRSVRADVLRAVADRLDAAADELVPLAQEETNLAEGRLRGELTRTTFQLRIFAEVITEGDYLDVRIDHADPDWPMGAPRPDLRRVLIPLGPVVVFAASNFPFAFSVAGGDTASAMAAGCSVILKAHPGHPRLSQRTGEIVVEALTQAGAPAGLFSVIFGTEEGRRALEDPRVKAGAFTGSIPGGRALFDIASSRPVPIPFYGELGSVNPVFVTRNADSARGAQIAEQFLSSATQGAGQFCTKPGVLFVPADSVIPAELVRLETPGAAALLNERIQSGYVESLEKLRDHEAVQQLIGDENGLASPPTPTILHTDIEAVLADRERVITEVFGPTALVVRYDDEQQLVEFARELDGQLTVSIFGEDGDDVLPALVRTLADRAGRLLWNQWPTGVSVTYAQQHGGPYPATTASGTTSVGTAAITRFLRPVAYQNFPADLLPAELRDEDRSVAHRRIDGELIGG